MPHYKLFTPDVYAKIRMLVAQGLSGQDIAERIGCTLPSLRVRCSQARISLRRPKGVSRLPAPSRPAPVITLRLTGATMVHFRRQADAYGVGTIKLITDLLEVIARDKLTHAVLDTKLKEAA